MNGGYDVSARPELEETVETQGEEQPQAAPAEPGALAVSVDEFSALEERVRRAVELVKRERQARAAAEERAGERRGNYCARSRRWWSNCRAKCMRCAPSATRCGNAWSGCSKQLDALEL